MWRLQRNSHYGVTDGFEYRRRDYESQNFHEEMLSRVMTVDNLFRYWRKTSANKWPSHIEEESTTNCDSRQALNDAVSYTHLDVYKRQTVPTIPPSIAPMNKLGPKIPPAFPEA